MLNAIPQPFRLGRWGNPRYAPPSSLYEICKTTDLRDTLLVLPPEQSRPSDSPGVLAL